MTRPERKARYNVGFTTFCATMSAGRVTRVQVFYPTLDHPNDGAAYPVFPPVNQSDPVGPCLPAGAELIPPELTASGRSERPSRPENDSHSIVHDHGGTAAGADFQRFSQLPVHETLASHGFVVVVALHSASALNRVLDVPFVIDAMLARNATGRRPLRSGMIDPNRVGISGESTGGATALRVAGGWSENGIVG